MPRATQSYRPVPNVRAAPSEPTAAKNSTTTQRRACASTGTGCWTWKRARWKSTCYARTCTISWENGALANPPAPGFLRGSRWRFQESWNRLGRPQPPRLRIVGEPCVSGWGSDPSHAPAGPAPDARGRGPLAVCVEAGQTDNAYEPWPTHCPLVGSGVALGVT